MAGKFICLDLDGTLWDSRPWYRELVIQRGAPDPAVSIDRGDPVATMLRNHGLHRDFEELCQKNGKSLKLYPKAIDVVDRLRSKGVEMAVVTNLPGWMAEPMLDACDLTDKFVNILPWERGANKATRLMRLGDNASYDPRWYVGDERNDSVAARKAGFRFAWAMWGYGTKPSESDTELGNFQAILEL